MAATQCRAARLEQWQAAPGLACIRLGGWSLRGSIRGRSARRSRSQASTRQRVPAGPGADTRRQPGRGASRLGAASARQPSDGISMRITRCRVRRAHQCSAGARELGREPAADVGSYAHAHMLASSGVQCGRLRQWAGAVVWGQGHWQGHQLWLPRQAVVVVHARPVRAWALGWRSSIRPATWWQGCQSPEMRASASTGQPRG